MEQAHKTTLRKFRVQLVNEMQIANMYDDITQSCLLTPTLLEHIKAKISRPDQVRSFLDLLPRRGPNAFDVFLRVLRDTGQPDLANCIEQEYVLQMGRLVISNPEVARSPATSPVTPSTENTGSQRLSGVQESRYGDTVAMETNSQSNHTAPGANKYTGNLVEEYRMESNPRGLLLIINNIDFHGHLSNRDGSNIDKDKLIELFQRQLGFGVEVRENLTQREIKLCLHQLSQHELLRKVDCLTIAILTHGNDEHIYGVDGHFINVNEAYRYFTAENCPQLHGKPKFFIMNACRGDMEDVGCIMATATSTSREGGESSVTHDILPEAPERTAQSRIPNMTDFLVAYSTVTGHVSWRHLHNGSFFIQGFVDVFKAHARTTDVVDMLVKVNRSVSQMLDHPGVQIPAPQVMLRKKWYLNPPQVRPTPTGTS